MQDTEGKTGFAERVSIGTIIAAAILGLLLLLGYLAEILLLVFASLLLAVFLRTLAQALSRLIPLAVGWSLALVSLILLAIVIVIFSRYGPLLVNGLYELWHQLPDSLMRLRISL